MDLIFANKERTTGKIYFHVDIRYADFTTKVHLISVKSQIMSLEALDAIDIILKPE
jgi:hypothetical protein